ASGVQGGDQQPRRLLQAVRGEEHAVREVAELGPRAGAQARLRDDGGGKVRCDAAVAQRRHGLHRLALVVGRERAEQGPAVRREEFAQNRRIHGKIFPRLCWSWRVTGTNLFVKMARSRGVNRKSTRLNSSHVKISY